jgi:hypothetical protein
MTETIIRFFLENNTNIFTIDNILQSVSLYDTDECYISVEKFVGERIGIDQSQLILKIYGSENTFDNLSDVSKVVPTFLVDMFIGNYCKNVAGSDTKTQFNIINPIDNWIKYNRVSLNKMIFELEGFVINFSYYIVLKLKFIKNK